VPRENNVARLFSQNFTQALVTAEVQLLQDGVTMDTFNIQIQDPNTKQYYQFGEQRAPLHIDESHRKSRTILDQMDTKVEAQRLVEEQKRIREENYDKVTKEFRKNLMERDYFALLFAVEEYDNDLVPPLTYPIDDAEKLKEVLVDKYNFKDKNVTILRNPSRNEISDSFYKLKPKINNTNSLLIFYGGHGEWDSEIEQGYWLPRDAHYERRGNWLSNSDIRDHIKMMGTQHTLLVTDACFSGGILAERSLPKFQYTAELEMYKLPSRKALSSGTLKTVPDRSVFMKYLIKYLEQNQEPFLSAEDLYYRFRKAVSNNTGNLPQYGAISGTGDEDGDFIFLKVDN